MKDGKLPFAMGVSEHKMLSNFCKIEMILITRHLTEIRFRIMVDEQSMNLYSFGKI
jgi:hypothetical protein